MVEPPPTHTPYDGSSKLFTIGLKPLDLADWIEVDRHYAAHISAKRRLYETIAELVFVEREGTREAQMEVLGLIRGHLAANTDRLFARPEQRGAYRANLADADAIAASDAPLRAASLLVQEDLILMRQDETGWRLVAGSLCFPSSWSLTEKFGKRLQDIHHPVPGFGPGTRPAELINRMFDRLSQPVERFNWSIQANNALYHPLSNAARIDRSTNRPSKFPDIEAAARAFIRVERQTLRRLPVSRDILFTIRIHLDPLALLARHPDRTALCRSFASQLTELDAAQLDYKGFTADRDRLIEALFRIANNAASAVSSDRIHRP